MPDPIIADEPIHGAAARRTDTGLWVSIGTDPVDVAGLLATIRPTPGAVYAIEATAFLVVERDPEQRVSLAMFIEHKGIRRRAAWTTLPPTIREPLWVTRSFTGMRPDGEAIAVGLVIKTDRGTARYLTGCLSARAIPNPIEVATLPGIAGPLITTARPASCDGRG